MDNELDANDLTTMSSTYSILTSDRILDYFGIHLEHDVLLAAIRNVDSVYHKILLVPFKNVINGIVLQQAYDYQVYLQKVFVDYLMSGQGNEQEGGIGANTRADMEANRLKLVQMSELFKKDTDASQLLIFEVQAELLALTQKMSPLQDTESEAQTIEESMRPFHERADEMGQVLRNYRSEFKTLIVDTLRLVDLLPDYKIDAQREEENRSTLQFDDNLG